jgi:maltose alpha-D-glucosyltransferase/alpha-amylase
VNPELEMGRFLTDVSPFPHIAPVLGAMEYFPGGNPREGGGEPVTLAVMQKFVENQGDLWSITLERLARLLDGNQGGPQADAENAAAGFHLGRMALLGRRVAEMHHALAKVTGDPAFDPEPVTMEDVAAWKTDALKEVDGAIDALGAASPNGAKLAAVRARLQERIAAVIPAAASAATGRGPVSLMKSRYHGDLHLGQILVAQDDFILVDFEGEPSRALERRRQKSCVLRDVAGMLRSFSYAAHAATQRREPSASGSASDSALARALADWERDASRHFLEGYAKASAALSTVPTDETTFRELLELFLIDKAAYELRYEIAHRPDWVAIPMRGLLDLVNP